MDDKPSCNIPVTEADVEGIRDGASEAHDPAKWDQVSTSAYWELRLVARIDELGGQLKSAHDKIGQITHDRGKVIAALHQLNSLIEEATRRHHDESFSIVEWRARIDRWIDQGFEFTCTDVHVGRYADKKLSDVCTVDQEAEGSAGKPYSPPDRL